MSELDLGSTATPAATPAAAAPPAARRAGAGAARAGAGRARRSRPPAPSRSTTPRRPSCQRAEAFAARARRDGHRSPDVHQEGRLDHLDGRQGAARVGQRVEPDARPAGRGREGRQGRRRRRRPDPGGRARSASCAAPSPTSTPTAPTSPASKKVLKWLPGGDKIAEVLPEVRVGADPAQRDHQVARVRVRTTCARTTRRSRPRRPTCGPRWASSASTTSSPPPSTTPSTQKVAELEAAGNTEEAERAEVRRAVRRSGSGGRTS